MVWVSSERASGAALSCLWSGGVYSPLAGKVPGKRSESGPAGRYCDEIERLDPLQSQPTLHHAKFF